MTYRALYEYGRTALQSEGIGEADLDARLLLEAVCNTTRNTLLVHPDRAVTPLEENEYRSHIEKRAKHIPLQHILGIQNFMGLDFTVNEHVLIPRQDTEILVEEAMKYLHDGMSILDMCTGSGCILISLLHYSNDCKGVGVDLSQEALTVAMANGAKILQGKEEATWIQSDLFTNVEGLFDMIVSNPPYIATSVVEELMEEVRDHEPRMALDGGADGLDLYKVIVKDAYRHLVPGGMLLLEIGYDQKDVLLALLQEQGYKETRCIKDYAGLDRVVIGQKGFL